MPGGGHWVRWQSLGKRLPVDVSMAGVPNSFQRTRASTSSALAVWPAVGAARPFRLSLSLTSIGSPGNPPVPLFWPPGRCDAARSHCEDECRCDQRGRRARKRTGWCAHGPSPPRRLGCRRLDTCRRLLLFACFVKSQRSYSFSLWFAGRWRSRSASRSGSENIGQCPVGSSRKDHCGPASSANQGCPSAIIWRT